MTTASAAETRNRFDEFPHLAKAPIAEAVIDIKATCANPLTPEKARGDFEGKIPGYIFKDIHATIQQSLKVEGGNLIPQLPREIISQGARFVSTDEKHVVQFNRDGIVFSRLPQYENWAKFKMEALARWAEFEKATSPKSIDRIGVRFINRFLLPPDDFDFGEYMLLSEPPFQKEWQLPYSMLHHEETLVIPDTPYVVKIARAVQPPEEKQLGVILDIDVIMREPTQDLRVERLNQHLDQMRFYKNKIFFGSLTQKALKMFV